MKKKLYIYLFIFCFCSNFNASDSLKTQNQVNVLNSTDPNELLLKYQTVLMEESKGYREYLENINNNFFYYLTLFSTMAGVLVTVFGIWKGRSLDKKFDKKADEDSNRVNNAIKDINAELKTDADTLLNEKTKEYSDKIQRLEQKLLESTKNEEFLGKYLLELVSEPKLNSTSPNDLRELKNKKILWVDDKPENYEAPIKLLKSVGLRLMTAINSTEGLNILSNSKTPYNLIITNMGRNGNDKEGINFIKEVRSIKTLIPIIIFTRPELIIKYGLEAEHAGANECVSDYKSLLQHIKSILGSGCKSNC